MFKSLFINYEVSSTATDSASEKTRDAVGKALIYLFFIALIPRLLNLFLMTSNDPFFLNMGLDHARYDEWAMLIINGSAGAEQVFYQDPLYPYVLAFIYLIFGHNYLVVFFIQCVMSAFSCVLIFRIGEAVFADRRVAMLGALFYAFYAPAIFYDSLLTKEPIGTLFFVASLYLLLRWREHRGIVPLVFSGFLLGLAVMTRGNFFLLVPIYALFVFVSEKNGYARKVLLCLPMLAGFFISISPCTIYNYMAEGDLILVNSQGGQNFYLGTNPLSTGTYTNLDFVRANPKYERTDFANEAMRRTGKKMTPSETSRFWYDESFKFIREEPELYLRLMWKKVGLFFNYFEVPDNRNFNFSKRYSFVLNYNPFIFWILGPIGLAGMLFALREPKKHWFLVSTILVYAAAVIIFIVLSRFKIQVIPLMLLFAAYFIFNVGDVVSGRKFKSAAIMAALFVASFFFIDRKIHDTDFYRYHSRLDLGYRYMDIGQYEQAIKEFKGAAPIKPTDTRARNLLLEAYKRQLR